MNLWLLPASELLIYFILHVSVAALSTQMEVKRPLKQLSVAPQVPWRIGGCCHRSSTHPGSHTQTLYVCVVFTRQRPACRAAAALVAASRVIWNAPTSNGVVAATQHGTDFQCRESRRHRPRLESNKMKTRPRRSEFNTKNSYSKEKLQLNITNHQHLFQSHVLHCFSERYI